MSPLIESIRQEKHQPVAARWGIKLRRGYVRFTCVIVLVLAAVLKGYQLYADPALGVLYGSRWLQAALVEYEMMLGMWLFSGVALPWARRVTLVTFLGFGCYSLYLGAAGHSSCGCFGQVKVNPWLTLAFDTVMIVLL